MKASKFNNYFDYENQKIGFNSLTADYIVIDRDLFSLFEAAAREDAVNDLQEIHPEFYDFLLEKGFIVENSKDEIEAAMELRNSVDFNDELYQLHINPTMNCNFKCWYCYETHIKDSKMDADTMNRVLAHTENVFNKQKGIKKFELSWFGGEPLLYFEKVMKPLLKLVYLQSTERNIEFSCGITTNGLLVNDNVISFSKKYSLNHFQITLDGNRFQHDKVRFITDGKGSYDKIVDNIKLLAFNGLNVSIRINVSEATLNGLEEILYDFSDVSDYQKSYIRFEFHKVWQVKAEIDDAIVHNRNLFRNAGFLVSYGAYDTVRHSCYGDRKNHATINYNGDVYKCTARDYNQENKEGVLSADGTIIWNDKYEDRLNIKFKNKPCLSCSILPICNGGCSQQGIEHKGVDYCVHDFDEQKKQQVVMNRFFETVGA